MQETPTDVQAVLAAEDRRYRAMRDADLPALEELCAEELSYAHSSGVRDSRDEYLATPGRAAGADTEGVAISRIAQSADARLAVPSRSPGVTQAGRPPTESDGGARWRALTLEALFGPSAPHPSAVLREGSATDAAAAIEGAH